MRNVNYEIEGFRNNPTLSIDKNWLFINPKAGLRYTSGKYSSFFSYALANKEPNRDDFEAGTTNIPKHETLHDFEAGIERTGTKLKLAATVYHMRYNNQLVLTGKINDVGAYTRTNIPLSYRTGLEIEATLSISDRLQINNNIALSSNKVRNHREFYDDYDAGDQKSDFYSSANIAFSPAVVEQGSISFTLLKDLEARLISKYVSRQYLDNTSRKDRSLDPYFTQDLMVNYSLHPKRMKSIELIFQLNNIWNKWYAPNGYTYTYKYGGEMVRNNFYFPMAERNLMIGLNLNF
jgi:iron complex outermembrane receptor protein